MLQNLIAEITDIDDQLLINVFITDSQFLDARKQTVDIVDIYFLSGLFLWVTTRPGRGRVVTDDLLKEMMSFESDKLSKDILKKLKASITYFQNQKHRMDYHFYREHNFPIGSMVTEDACKTLVKQRLCQSGMKW